jgi:uncharacterized protein (DUF305 family)
MSIKVVGIIGVLAFTVGIGSGFMLDSDTEDITDSLTEATAPSEVYGKMQKDVTLTEAAEKLQAKSGEAQDIAFLESMIAYHEGAVNMAKAVVTETKRPEIKKEAEDIISTQTSEITLMKEWLNKWYGR